MSPGGVMNASPDEPPRISVLRQMRPGLFCCALAPVPSARRSPARRSTTPFLPNDMIDLPVRASIACRKLLTENSSRRSLPSSLCQKLMPLLTMPFRPSWTQISLPVVASSATSDGAVAAQAVQHAVHGDGTEGRGGERIEPRDLQVLHVGLRDLVHVHVVRAVGVRQHARVRVPAPLRDARQRQPR